MIEILYYGRVFSIYPDGSYFVKGKQDGYLFFPVITPEEFDILLPLYEDVRKPIPYGDALLYVLKNVGK